MTDVAYQCMSKRKKEVEFSKLWQEVAKSMKIPEEQLARKKASFYSELMLDNRFASLKGNKWDLRNRRSYDEVRLDQVEADDMDDEELEEVEEEEGLDLPKGEDEY